MSSYLASNYIIGYSASKPYSEIVLYKSSEIKNNCSYKSLSSLL